MAFARNYLRRRQQRIRGRANAGGFSPAVVPALYGFPKVSLAKDPVIAILELGGGFVPSDVSSYFAALGLPAPIITEASVRGAANSPGGDADAEVFLDIVIAAAAYSYMTGRAARILVIWSPNDANGIADAISAAGGHSLKPATLSCSWGQAEAGWSTSSVSATESALKAFPSMAFYSAAGDNGSGDGGPGNNVDYPGSSAYATSCGGTSITVVNGAITQETVWNDGGNGGATGGGYSNLFQVPAFQAGVLPAGTGKSRGCPDYSAVGDPETGWDMGPKFGIVGGTSAVAPFFAALGAVIYALTNKPMTPAAVYPLAKTFRDVLVGSNGSYSATPGWDPASGLGAPVGTAILAGLSGSTPPPPPPTPTTPTPTVKTLFQVTTPAIRARQRVVFVAPEAIPAGTYNWDIPASSATVAHVED